MTAGLRNGIRAAGAVTVALAAAACGSSSETSTAPTPSKCVVAVQSSGATTFGATGGPGTLNVTTNRECGWSVQSDAGWLTIGTTTTGRGNGVVGFTVAPNGDATPRAAHVRVEDQQIDIAQQAAPCDLHLSSTQESFGGAGGERSVHVRASSPTCTWVAVPADPWIAIVGGRQGSGEGDVRIRVAAMTGPLRRGSVAIGGHAVTVVQSEQPEECAVTVDPSVVAVPGAGGSAVITVRAGGSCPWTASSDADWITIAAGAAGTGAGEVRLTVAASEGTDRSGSIRVADQKVVVTQGSGCSVSVQPSKIDVSAAGGTEVLEIAAHAGCGWSASSRAGWLSVTSAAHGTGAARVSIAVAENSGSARSGEVAIGDQTVTFSQAGGCHYAVAPTAVEVPGAGGTASVALTTEAGCSWNAASRDSWITLPTGTGTGSGQVEFSVAPNLAPARTGTVTVAGESISVAQPSSCTYDLRPPSHTFDAQGGHGNVLVLVSGPCTWKTVSRSPWIRVTAGESGIGEGLVQFVADPNTGPARTGSLTIAGREYVVTEGAGQ